VFPIYEESGGEAGISQYLSVHHPFCSHLTASFQELSVTETVVAAVLLRTGILSAADWTLVLDRIGQKDRTLMNTLAYVRTQLAGETGASGEEEEEEAEKGDASVE
jgi:hypothetical protein